MKLSGGDAAIVGRTACARNRLRSFGDGKAIGALCADEDDADVVSASLAWWALRRNGRILSNDPDVERYAAKVGVIVTGVPPA